MPTNLHLVFKRRLVSLDSADRKNAVEAIAFRAYEAHCLEQEVKCCRLRRIGSLNSATPIHNNSYDDEYTLIGSYFHGTVLAESRGHDAHAALSIISYK